MYAIQWNHLNRNTSGCLIKLDFEPIFASMTMTSEKCKQISHTSFTGDDANVVPVHYSNSCCFLLTFSWLFHCTW